MIYNNDELIDMYIKWRELDSIMQRAVVGKQPGDHKPMPVTLRAAAYYLAEGWWSTATTVEDDE